MDDLGFWLYLAVGYLIGWYLIGHLINWSVTKYRLRQLVKHMERSVSINLTATSPRVGPINHDPQSWAHIDATIRLRYMVKTLPYKLDTETQYR